MFRLNSLTDIRWGFQKSCQRGAFHALQQDCGQRRGLFFGEVGPLGCFFNHRVKSLSRTLQGKVCVCSFSHQWNSSCPPSLTMRMGWQSGMMKNLKGHSLGTSLVVQWLRLVHTMQVAWVPSLVGELRSHMSHMPHIPGWGVKIIHIILNFFFFFCPKDPKHKTSNIVTDSIQTLKKIFKKKTFPQPLFPDSRSPTGDAAWCAVSQRLLPHKLHVPFWLCNFPSGNSLLQEIL